MLAPKSVVDLTGEYLCEILIKNSGDYYIMGDTLLRNYYSVYDLENYKMALGEVIDFEAPFSNGGANGAEGSDPTDPDGKLVHDNVRNGLIFAGISLAFIIFAICVCKRRAASDRRGSGSQAARGTRKKLTLTEEDPNRSLVEGQEGVSDLQFVGDYDDEEADEDQLDEETISPSVIEAEDE